MTMNFIVIYLRKKSLCINFKWIVHGRWRLCDSPVGQTYMCPCIQTRNARATAVATTRKTRHGWQSRVEFALIISLHGLYPRYRGINAYRQLRYIYIVATCVSFSQCYDHIILLFNNFFFFHCKKIFLKFL